MKSKQSKNRSKGPSGFLVEKNVPIPSGHRGRSSPMTEFASTLKPTESFLVEGVKGGVASQRMQSVRKKFPARRFAVRTVEGGARIWRTK